MPPQYQGFHTRAVLACTPRVNDQELHSATVNSNTSGHGHSIVEFLMRTSDTSPSKLPKPGARRRSVASVAIGGVVGSSVTDPERSKEGPLGNASVSPLIVKLEPAWAFTGSMLVGG